MKPGQSDSDSGAELAHHMYKAEPGMGGLSGMTDGHHHPEHAGMLLPLIQETMYQTQEVCEFYFKIVLGFTVNCLN